MIGTAISALRQTLAERRRVRKRASELRAGLNSEESVMVDSGSLSGLFEKLFEANKEELSQLSPASDTSDERGSQHG
jgi:hypothetical protein